MSKYRKLILRPTEQVQSKFLGIFESKIKTEKYKNKLHIYKKLLEQLASAWYVVAFENQCKDWVNYVYAWVPHKQLNDIKVGKFNIIYLFLILYSCYRSISWCTSSFTKYVSYYKTITTSN